MTYTIPPGTPKAVKAAAFGRELLRALSSRSVTLNELARSIGIGHTALDHYRTGSVLPKTATAQAMAAALDWPRLGEMIMAARTFVCGRPGCSRTYRHEDGGPRRYCTPTCQRLAEQQRIASKRLRQAGQTDDGRQRAAAIARLRSAAQIADERAVMAEDAIAAMCRDCEPEGLCRQEACPLRPFSPLPLRTRAGRGLPRTDFEVRREAGARPEVRAGRSVAMRARHADPVYAARHSASLKAEFAQRTPEERERWIASIAAGKAARTPEENAASARKAWATRRAAEAPS